MVDGLWCVVFLLPFPWNTLLEPNRNALAFALQDCNGRPFDTNRDWIDNTLVRQSDRDGLGLFTVVNAWSTSSRAEGCKRSVLAADDRIPVRVECLSTPMPRTSWWNQTCVADIVQMPSTPFDYEHTTAALDTAWTERMWLIACAALGLWWTCTYLCFWQSIPKPAAFALPHWNESESVPPRHRHSQHGAAHTVSSSLHAAPVSFHMFSDDEEDDVDAFSPYGSIRDIGGGGATPSIGTYRSHHPPLASSPSAFSPLHSDGDEKYDTDEQSVVAGLPLL
jgi:hypothetical protein